MVSKVVPVLDFGGIETHRLLMAKYHDKQEYDLSFLCLSTPRRIAHEVEALGYEVSTSMEGFKIPNFRLITKLFKFLKAESPDVVHACVVEANFHVMVAGI